MTNISNNLKTVAGFQIEEEERHQYGFKSPLKVSRSPSRSVSGHRPPLIKATKMMAEDYSISPTLMKSRKVMDGLTPSLLNHGLR